MRGESIIWFVRVSPASRRLAPFKERQPQLFVTLCICDVSRDNPAAHGASAADSFHLVIPSLPGYGFSGKPTTTGWGPERTARAWVVLMKRLGYDTFAAQGGDLGGVVANVMGKQAPSELLGIHVNFSRDSTGGYCEIASKRRPAAGQPVG